MRHRSEASPLIELFCLVVGLEEQLEAWCSVLYEVIGGSIALGQRMAMVRISPGAQEHRAASPKSKLRLGTHAIRSSGLSWLGTAKPIMSRWHDG